MIAGTAVTSANIGTAQIRNVSSPKNAGSEYFTITAVTAIATTASRMPMMIVAARMGPSCRPAESPPASRNITIPATGGKRYKAL